MSEAARSSAGLSLPHVYTFTGIGWGLRTIQSAGDGGILTHTTVIDLNCRSRHWRPPKYSCRLHLVEMASGHPGHEGHPTPYCGILNLFYEEEDGEPKGELTAELWMATDSITLMHRMLVVPGVRTSVALEFSESLKNWNGERQVYCDKYAVEFRPDQKGEMSE